MKRTALVTTCLDFASRELQSWGDLGRHEWSHTCRVLDLAQNLAEAEARGGASPNIEVIQLAVALHDVALLLEESSCVMSHALKGA